MKYLIILAAFLYADLCMAQTSLSGVPVDMAPVLFASGSFSSDAVPLTKFADAKECDALFGLSSGNLGGVDRLIALWVLAMGCLRLLAEGLGRLPTPANRAAQIIVFVLRILGWLSGKMGWGSPNVAKVKTFPKL
jgi:hypothetical protein